MPSALPAALRSPTAWSASISLLCCTQTSRCADERLSLVAGGEPIESNADPIAIRRLFGNLIDNAIAAADRRQVNITREIDHAVVTVDDDGPGIPEAEREAVLEPFYCLDRALNRDRARNRDRGGSGLGLAIARQVVDGHGGTIEIGVSPLGGARITINLPVPALP